MTTDSRWQSLLQSILETEEYEIDCRECFDLLDTYAELLLEGDNSDEIMPTVKQHLKQCNCCVNELEALMIMIDKAVAQEEEQDSG
jgi:hypothetical protein